MGGWILIFGAVELVSQEEVATMKALGHRADGVGEGYRFLLDLEFLEGEGHAGSIFPYPDSGKEKVLRQAQDK
jgi:hypothetical protein